jgi:hypothetical protein
MKGTVVLDSLVVKRRRRWWRTLVESGWCGAVCDMAAGVSQEEATVVEDNGRVGGGAWHGGSGAGVPRSS